MQVLDLYTPIIIGTIPLNIDVEGSDIDIACCYNNADNFLLTLQRFSLYKKYDVAIKNINDIETIICNFEVDSFPIEIFGQPIPVKMQYGFRHMIAEYNILQQQTADFRDEVIALKRSGMKTEPAFAQLLQLSGDPYQAILDYTIPQ